jgi:hypothetical protein
MSRSITLSAIRTLRRLSSKQQSMLRLGVDDTQLRYVISLSRFADGESALNFGSLLLEVERTIGARRFERTLSTVPQETRELATAQMKAAKQMKELVERTRA